MDRPHIKTFLVVLAAFSQSACMNVNRPLTPRVEMREDVQTVFSVRHASHYPYGIGFTVDGRHYEFKPGETLRVPMAGTTNTLSLWQCPSGKCRWVDFKVTGGKNYKITDKGDKGGSEIVEEAGISIPLALGCATKSVQQTKWEYKVVAVHESSEAQLNELGKEGWELVSQWEGQAFCLKRPVRGDKLPNLDAEQKAKVVEARRMIDVYKTALGLYELDNGMYPTMKQGLEALITPPQDLPNWKGPYLDPPIIRRDQWGRNFIYRNPGQTTPNGYDLVSPGPDGVEGTKDDIGNHEEKP